MVVYGSDRTSRGLVRKDSRSVLKWIPIGVLILSGCGGGGGGGGGSSGPIPSPIITQPSPGFQISSSEIANSNGLHLIAASELYEKGGTGSGHEIAILDSGVDAAHAELTGRVYGGGDWQGNTGGITDPNGHGTHVASIAAASRDGAGIQGIAPDSEIVSYRILNDAGFFGRQTGNTMIPPIITDIRQRGISIVNNSWSSYYEITDFSANVIEQALTDELNSYRQIATTTGPILVWAAGNGSDGEVSIRGGLPHYFPELEDNWLTVVAVDADGHEPSYTNRCGLSAAWCITAPGGGDDEDRRGILGAQSGGGYTLKSGTSMAAPYVSGALSLLMEAMPTISPQAAATRLKQTASLAGLTTSSGCTISDCTENVMRDVFGHGLINVAAALNPIGTASLVTGTKTRTPWTLNAITSPIVIGPALKESFKGAVAVIHDDFDGALMLTRLDGIVHDAQPKRRYAWQDAEQPFKRTAPKGLFFIAAPSAPKAHYSQARLIDIPSAPTDVWQGWSLAKAHSVQRAMIGYGAGRRVIHLMQTLQHDTNTPLWFGMGMDETQGWLDATGTGGFAISQSRSQWAFAGLTHHHGAFETTAELLFGQTDLTPAQSALIQDAHLEYDAAGLSSVYHGAGFDIGLRLEQPAALRHGHITINQPHHIGVDSIGFTPRRFALDLESRERHHALRLDLYPSSASTFTVATRYIANHGHVTGQHDRQVEFSYKIAF